jgi:N-sulfoglucosamine sulfohydrolase
VSGEENRHARVEPVEEEDLHLTARSSPSYRPLFILLTLLLAVAQAGAVGRGAAPSRPNILFVIADDWSYGHASVYGCRWVKTPAFDRVAREGVRFNHCFTNNPKCSPCRASLLTGRNTWQLEEACNHNGIFPSKFRVYPDLLEDAGYHVGYTGKGWGPGDWKSGGFQRNPAGPDYNAHKLKPPLRGISTNDYARNFEAFLEARKSGRPFCFWYGASEPHRTYEEGAGLRSGMDPSNVELPAYYPDSNVIRSDFLDYALEVEWFDGHLGRMIRKLEETGELDDTLIVVTSDHGCPFPRVKGQIYEHGYHLPLAIRWGRRIKGGRTVDDFINVRDFAPTFLELAGLKPHPQMTGRSFIELLRSERSGWVDRSRSRMVIGKERHDLGRPNDWGYPVRALRTPEYLYVHNYRPERWPVCNPETGYRNCDDGPSKEFILSRFDRYYRLSFGRRPEEELYRVDRDPDCATNIAADPQSAAVRKELRREMEALLREDRDPRVLGKGEVFDTYRYVGDRKHAYDTWLKSQ